MVRPTTRALRGSSSRPDLISIFGGRQQKPRSAKLAKAKVLSAATSKISRDILEQPPPPLETTALQERSVAATSKISRANLEQPSPPLKTTALQKCSVDWVSSEVLSAATSKISRDNLEQPPSPLKTTALQERSVGWVSQEVLSAATSKISRDNLEQPPPPLKTTALQERSVDWVAQAKRLLAPGLFLPTKLINLEQAFQAMETTMSVHRARRRHCVLYPELALGVEGITKKAFTKSHLAKILYLFPQAYSVHIKSTKNKNSGRTENILAITMLEHNNCSDLNQIQRNQLRAEIFHNALLNFVFAFYLQWLKQNYADLHGDIEAQGLSGIQHWHPRFPLDECPSVTHSPLPETLLSAASIELARLVGVGSSLRDSTALSKVQSGNIINSNPENIKDASLSLLQRIRLKEAAAKEMAHRLGSKEDIQNNLDLTSLPEFVVLVHGMFSALGKSSMLFSAFIAQLKFKLKQQFVPEASVLNRVDLLTKLVPSFCKRVIDGRVEAFCVDLNANVAHLRAELRSAIRKQRLLTQ